jgi:CBS domain-containing protein
VQEAAVRAEAETISLRQGAALREALARMLGQGMERLPVLDAGGRLVGEITLGDVVRATTGGGKP